MKQYCSLFQSLRIYISHQFKRRQVYSWEHVSLLQGFGTSHPFHDKIVSWVCSGKSKCAFLKLFEWAFVKKV